MLNQIYYHAANTSAVTTVIIPIALMLFLGFCMTRITKQLRLPNVTAYILTGILIGPYCLNLIPQNFIQGSDFLADIALAFIAFSVGEFFKLSTLKKNGLKSAVITLFEALMASLTVFIMTYFILHLNMAFSIVLAALASATAPASTIMTIRQTGAHGDFVGTLLQVVAMDDVVGLVAYSVAISIAVSSLSGASSGNIFETMLLPILTNLFALVLGGSFAFLMKMLISTKRSTDNRLIISVSILFLFCGICAVLDVSPLLGCMAMGMVYINITKDDKLFKQLNYFNPPILLLFFVRSGVSFNLGILTGSGSLVGNVSVLTVGILYFITRIIGKYTGAFLGCLITGKSAEVRNYLGLALYLSHSYSDVLENLTEVSETTDSGTPKTQVEILIERLQQIQEELPSRLMMENDAEQAFTQAAEEQYENYGTYSTYSKGHFLNLK
ncbi:cation:proton antiporter [Frisingicoccus sp.]|uniref:cation:proton antiporter n=1 Tax=Frisingicoccus sp. TaxID=1918627 RepID=UPI003AB2ED73